LNDRDRYIALATASRCDQKTKAFVARERKEKNKKSIKMSKRNIVNPGS
jgi:hypothetical protein